MPISSFILSFFLFLVSVCVIFFNFNLILAGLWINVVSTSTHTVSFSGQFRNSMKDFWPLNGSLGVRMDECISIYIYMTVNLFSFLVLTINVNETHGICKRSFYLHPSCVFEQCCRVSFFSLSSSAPFGWSHSHEIAREPASSLAP